jgi:hypothetical protein
MDKPKGKGRKKKNEFSKKVNEALMHKDKFREGEKKRKKLHLTPAEYKDAVLAEWKQGTLFSGDGKKVPYPEDKKRALAIALRKMKPKKGGK